MQTRNKKLLTLTVSILYVSKDLKIDCVIVMCKKSYMQTQKTLQKYINF